MKHAEDESKWTVDCGAVSLVMLLRLLKISAATLIGHCRLSLLLIRYLNSKAFAHLSVR
jgi:hypothetical protein